MTRINWHVSKQEHNVIVEIATRAAAIARNWEIEYPLHEIVMDLTAVHANGCKLRLTELSSAEQFDFTHDVFGIRQHIDRKTGQLTDRFLPRYAEVQS